MQNASYHVTCRSATPATMAVGQHAVRAGKFIPVPTWTGPQAGESIFVQKWNTCSSQGGKVHYADAATRHQMTAGDLQLSSNSSCMW